ncbi:hypothetical protein ACH3XW_45135 [Acanthocheilonema viteae]
MRQKNRFPIVLIALQMQYTIVLKFSGGWYIFVHQGKKNNCCQLIRMSSTEWIFKKCAFASSCVLKNPMQRTEKHNKFTQTCDTRNEVTLRVYAMAESFQQNYSAEAIIDEIRKKIFSHRDPYNLFSKQNTTIFNDIMRLLGTLLQVLMKEAKDKRAGTENEMPSVGIVIIRSNLLCCGFFGKIVFALITEQLCALQPDESKHYAIFSNKIETPIMPKTSNDIVNETQKKHSKIDNDRIKIFTQMIKFNDIRFFLFNVETIEALFECQADLCIISHSELTWILHQWQKNMYSANPFDVPSAGYLLIDRLSQVIVDDGSTSVNLLKRQQDYPWNHLPKLDPIGLGSHFLSSSFERRLRDFYKLTENIREADLEQSNEMHLCLGRKQLLEETQKQSEIVPNEILSEMEEMWMDYYSNLKFAGRRIKMLMTRVQYELRPALEFLNHGNIYDVTCGYSLFSMGNYFQFLIRGLWIYDHIIYEEIENETVRCNQLITHWAEKGVVLERDLEALRFWKSDDLDYDEDND